MVQRTLVVIGLMGLAYACQEEPLFYYFGAGDTGAELDADPDSVSGDTSGPEQDTESGDTSDDSDAQRDTSQGPDTSDRDVSGPSCEEQGLEACGVQCVDTASNRLHCGECGFACGDDEACVEGECRCPCSNGACDEGACLTLAPGSGAQHTTTTLVTTTRAVDVVINFDTTSSMSGALSRVKAAFSTSIVPQVTAMLPDVAWGLTTFEDFPCGGYGTAGDLPFELRERVTTFATDVASALNAITLGNGADISESGIEALYQIATGEGGSGCVTTPAFDPELNRVEGVADGVIGGVGFRDAALPVVLHITDATSHQRGVASFPYGATMDETTNAFRALGARLIGLSLGDAPRSQLNEIVTGVGTTVPTCAWGSDGARPADCDLFQCCTGAQGAGVAPSEVGECPLVFDLAGSGVGIDSVIINALSVLSHEDAPTLRLQAIPDPSAMDVHGLNTTCVIDSLEVTSFSHPTSLCGRTTGVADFDSDGRADGLVNARAGTTVNVALSIQNDCITVPGLYDIGVELRTESGDQVAVAAIQFYVPHP